jgi:hypothetical protein
VCAIDQAYDHTAEQRLTDTFYSRDWYNYKEGQILACGTESDALNSWSKLE